MEIGWCALLQLLNDLVCSRFDCLVVLRPIHRKKDFGNEKLWLVCALFDPIHCFVNLLITDQHVCAIAGGHQSLPYQLRGKLLPEHICRNA